MKNYGAPSTLSLRFQSREKRAFESLPPPPQLLPSTPQEMARGKAGPDFINFICSNVSPE